MRTSFLSTKWRYKWCRIPQLKLDQTLWGITKDKMPLIIKFTSIIYHLLTSHVGPVSKFILTIYQLGDCPVIDKLIYFLSRSSVQHLHLRFSAYNKPKLPSSIFTCSQLMHLSLTGCSIQLVPPAFKGFDRLISLELCSITISSKLLESLISDCPLLDQLRLHNNVYFDVIEINAPMLRSFDFIEMEGSICLTSVPHVVKLSLCIEMGTRNCFESFYYLEHLELNGHILKIFAAAAGEVSTRLPFDLNYLKRLHLEYIYLGELDVALCVLFLLRSFQYLQHLEIQVDDEDDDIPALQCLELEAFSYVTFNHLRKVKLRGTIGSDPEMQLIKFLLAKSPMLKEM